MKKPPPPIRSGEVITADFLNQLRYVANALGWGSGSRTGGKLDSPGVRFFKAQEDFGTYQDIYRGDAKEWWYDGNNAYAVHNDAIKVYSHTDDVAADDVFSATFNVQSGRWEKIYGPRGSTTTTTTTTPCGCDFVSEGSVDCLGTGDSANVYVVDDLGPLGTNVELTFDASCEWISEDIDYNCSGS